MELHLPKVTQLNSFLEKKKVKKGGRRKGSLLEDTTLFHHDLSLGLLGGQLRLLLVQPFLPLQFEVPSSP